MGIDASEGKVHEIRHSSRGRRALRRPVASLGMDRGSHTIIAFGYASRADVDLWYADSGCRILDNGLIGAFEGGNPSFYGAFEPRLEELCPQQP